MLYTEVSGEQLAALSSAYAVFDGTEPEIRTAYRYGDDDDTCIAFIAATPISAVKVLIALGRAWQGFALDLADSMQCNARATDFAICFPGMVLEDEDTQPADACEGEC